MGEEVTSKGGAVVLLVFGDGRCSCSREVDDRWVGGDGWCDVADVRLCRLKCDAVRWVGWNSIRWDAYTPEGELGHEVVAARSA